MSAVLIVLGPHCLAEQNWPSSDGVHRCLVNYLAKSLLLYITTLQTTTVIIPRPSVFKLVSLCSFLPGPPHLLWLAWLYSTSMESRFGLPPWHLEVKPSEHFSWGENGLARAMTRRPGLKNHTSPKAFLPVIWGRGSSKVGRVPASEYPPSQGTPPLPNQRSPVRSNRLLSFTFFSFKRLHEALGQCKGPEVLEKQGKGDRAPAF